MDASTCTIRIHSSARKLVFEVAGRLDQEVVSTFESQLRASLWGKSNPVLLDLSELTFIDSNGVRALFAVSQAFERAGGQAANQASDHARG